MTTTTIGPVQTDPRKVTMFLGIIAAFIVIVVLVKWTASYPPHFTQISEEKYNELSIGQKSWIDDVVTDQWFAVRNKDGKYITDQYDPHTRAKMVLSVVSDICKVAGNDEQDITDAAFGNYDLDTFYPRGPIADRERDAFVHEVYTNRICQVLP